MHIDFLEVEDVLDVHFDQIQRYGGDPSIRDYGLLESAVNMPRASFGGQFMHEFPHEMAAAYMFHLVANHPFVDGNKRTGLGAALLFLDWHGLQLASSKQETGDLVLDVATGKADKAACVAFFKRFVK
jgi:death on curing protein